MSVAPFNGMYSMVPVPEGGVIKADAVRHLQDPNPPCTREGLLEKSRMLDPVELRWGR